MLKLYSDLHFRVLSLILLAVIPAMGLMLYNNVEQKWAAELKAKEEALLITRIAATYHERLISETRQLLLTLSQLPAVAERNSDACNPLLGNLLKQFPNYANLAGFDSEGNVYCTAVPFVKDENFQNFPWFQRAVQSRGFAAGDYQIGRITPTAILVFSYPLIDAADAVQGVIIASLDLAWLNALARQIQLPQGSTLTIRDSNGVILARHPDPGEWVGKSMPDSSIVKAILAREGKGTAVSTGVDDVERLYAFSTLQGFSEGRGAVYLSVGIPTAIVFANAERIFSRSVVYLLIVGMLAFLAAGVGSHFFVMKRVNVILGATKRLTAGDLTARVSPPYGPGELGEIGQAFDGMAGALEERTSKLRETEAKYRSLVEQIPAVTYVSAANDPMSTTYISPQIQDLLGYTPEEWTAGPHLKQKSIHPEDRERVIQEIHLLCADSSYRQFRSEYRLLTRLGHDKKIVWVLDEAFVTRLEIEKVCFVQGILTNITALKEAQETMEHLRHQNELILNSAGEGIIGLDMRGDVTFVNPAAAKALGYEVSELLGWKMHHKVHHSRLDGRDYPERECPICVSYTKGIVCSSDREVFWKKDGTCFPIEYVSTPIGERGESKGTVVVFKDISVRKKTEEELIRLFTAVEQSAESVLITDASLIIRYVNPAFERISGYKKEEILGEDPRVLRSGKHELGYYRTIRDTLSRGEAWKGHLVNRRKDGSLYEVEGTISPIRDQAGAIINYVSVQRDVTHEAKLERQLRQAQKMEAIGRLAGGIAHDFNNILTAILGYTEITIESQPEGSATWSHLVQVLKAAKRARDLVSQILTFSRQSEHEPKPIQLHTLIKESVLLLRASLPTTVEIRQNLETDADTVLADPTQIHQVLMNLCTNAAHAMQDKGGVLDLTLSEAIIRPDGAPEHQELKPGPYLRLAVSDTGCGIDRTTQARIFDPYFTTKGKGEGTGLGLAVVHGIIKSHGGTITVSSRLGEGSTFHVFLPKLERYSPAAFSPAEGPAPIPRGTERIMLVDDESSIVEMAQLMLEALGYKIIPLTNSLEALEVFQGHSDEIDLVITDQTMPNMTGTALAAQLLRIKPGIPIILCTGFSERITREKALSLGIKDYIMKPLVRRELTTAIRSALDA